MLKKLQEVYEKYDKQSEQENPDRNIDYREEIALLVENAICDGVEFSKLAEILKNVKEL